MFTERVNLTPDGRVYMDCYVQDWTPVKPFLPTRPAVLICPGGAYIMISEREGEPVALAFAAKGVNAFVLNYSIGFYARFPNPVIDAALAMKAIRQNSSKWHIDPDKIAVAGFSAGGHVASCLATMAGRQDILSGADAAEEEIRPNALILGYGVTTVDKDAMEGLFCFLAAERDIDEIKHEGSASQFVDNRTPPAFVFTFYNDMLVPMEQSFIFCQAMASHDRPFELHVFGVGEHACALGDEATALCEDGMYDPSVSKWMELCSKWLCDLFGKPDLGRKYESMLQSTAVNRAHLGLRVLPINMFEPMVTRKTAGKHFSLTTRLGDVADDDGGMKVLEQFFPEIAHSPRIGEIIEMPVQALVLSAGGSMTKEDVLSLAKALRNA